MSNSRPQSKGLPTAVGTPPPASRSGKVATPGTAQSGTGPVRTPKTGDASSPLSVLQQKLIIKMRTRFGEAAADVKSQEIITQQVVEYMSQASRGHGTEAKDSDLGELERRIRERLSGGTPPKMTFTLEKKAQVEGDEWAKIFQYNIKMGKAVQEAEAITNRHKQEQQRAVLARQQQEIEDRKKKEKEEAEKYFKEQTAALKAWEAEEAKKRQVQEEIIHRLAEDRQRQLAEKNERIRRARAQAEKEDMEMAAKIVYEAQQELRKEEQERTEAKSSLKTFLIGNEVNKKIREEAKQREFALDEEYAKQWNAIIDKQDKERTNRLEAAKERSKARDAAASTRYADELAAAKAKAIADAAYVKAQEEARDRDEQERKRKQKEGALAAAATYAEQAKAREAEKRKEKEREEALNRAILERVAAEERAEQEKLRKAMEQKLKLKEEILNQMKDNARRRRVAPMSETEKKLNQKLLVEVHEFEATGKLSATSSPKVLG